MNIVPPHCAVPFAMKTRFLRHPGSYPHAPADVEFIETHFACVFLAGRYAYKLKKPIRFYEIDFTTVELRRTYCELEFTLNMRLAEAVYIAVVPLLSTGKTLTIDSAAGGTIVDWLVKMHRLPRERMLDARAAAGPIGQEELRELVAKLVAYYARAHRAAWDGPEYLRRLELETRQRRTELLAYESSLGECPIERIVAGQVEFLQVFAKTLEARCAAGRIVDAHGDLRPEHILLGENPQIIDCLEFSAALRLLDTAEEIMFLALECEQLDRADLAHEITALYRELSGDFVSQNLLDFYSSRRAMVRALICVRHLDEPMDEDLRRRWIERGHGYLAKALDAITHALAVS
ncbi:hypothetical protein ACG33_15125 [Steroidobacter denitrificans]|uniref:Aminoglycoside phosphotransferase domain-containing protein n=2 Tax=Steroidobacter denitrificans TaxID=465721 RepID=A0A127FEQ9_STEDE|nr:hypothetical protein ACG33_15125 [Steroidobacter denitrificans]